MELLVAVLHFALFIYLILLIGRLILDWIRVFSPSWRPKGLVLVLAELVFTATDPPLRALRKVIPPLRLGSMALDMGFLVLILVVSVLLQLTG